MNNKIVWGIRIASMICGFAGGSTLLGNPALGIALISLGSSIMALGYVYLISDELSRR